MSPAAAAAAAAAATTTADVTAGEEPQITEHCQDETFQANCGQHQIIIIDKARYVVQWRAKTEMSFQGTYMIVLSTYVYVYV